MIVGVDGESFEPQPENNGISNDKQMSLIILFIISIPPSYSATQTAVNCRLVKQVNE